MYDLISTDNVARFLGVTRPTVIKYIQDGKLNATRVGKAYKIAKPDLEDFARGMGMNGARIAELDRLAKGPVKKKTQALNIANTLSELVAHQPSRPLIPEPDVLYFVAVRMRPDTPEIIFRVHAAKYFIGRHSLASLSIQDPYVSSLHATLLYSEELVKVIDQSTNGTQVRGATLKSGDAHTLGDGDQIRVGSVILTLISAQRIEEYLAGINL